MPILKIIANAALLVGLVLALLGAVVAAKAVIVTPDQALEIGQSRWSADTKEENLKLPAVRNLVEQSAAARNGLLLIALGTLLQIIGTVIGLLEP